MEIDKVHIVVVKFYRGDGNNLKEWQEIKGIFTSSEAAEKFIEKISSKYERVDFLIKEELLNTEIKDL